MIYVISQIKFISESNRKFIRNGYFVVKNVGISFQKIVNIRMVEQESQKYWNNFSYVTFLKTCNYESWIGGLIFTAMRKTI